MAEKIPVSSRTKLFFYEDPDLLDFEAEVLEERGRDGRTELVLSRTAFFPGGGGQPEDFGTLDGIRVQGFLLEGEELFHLVDERLWRERPAGAGSRVSGRVDGTRRAFYREQHTAQHLLSACLKTLLDADTVSVHFGETSTTIEVASSALPEAGLREVEEEANRLIARNLKVETFWIAEEDLPNYRLRRTPAVAGRLRIVRVEGVDTSACCGVHLPSLGSLGFAKILGEERIRGRVRLRATAGRLLLGDYTGKVSAVERLKTLFTCGEEDLEEAAQRLLDEQKKLRRKSGDQRRELFGFRVRELLAGAPRFPLSSGGAAALLLSEQAEAEELSDFVSAALLSPGLAVCAASPSDGRVSWVVAHNLDVRAEPGLDLKRLLPPLLAERDGKGGGSSSRFQGGFVSREEWGAFLVSLKRALGIAG